MIILDSPGYSPAQYFISIHAENRISLADLKCFFSKQVSFQIDRQIAAKPPPGRAFLIQGSKFSTVVCMYFGN
jgi:hypothetical protein